MVWRVQGIFAPMGIFAPQFQITGYIGTLLDLDGNLVWLSAGSIQMLKAACAARST